MADPVRYPVPPAVWAMEPRRHQVVEASAGTGKTYLLERRVVDLLLRGGATVDQILLVTFTEKATAELRRRVRELLRELAMLSGPVGPALAADAPHWRIDGAARAALQGALYALDGAAIHTIHGFCHRVLQSTAFDGRRPFRQTQVATETALADAFTACLRDTLSVEGEPRVLLEAWLASGRRLADVTRALGDAMRLGGRLARAYQPDRLDAALAEFAAALAALGFDRLAAALRAARVHPNTAGAAERRARALAELAARRKRGCELPLLLDDIDDHAHELACKLPAAGAGGAAAPELARLARAADALAAAAAPLHAAVVAAFLPPVRERLERDKAERGQFDYGDMLELVWRALTGPSGGELAARLRARYPFALIDEFQDTDELQWNIFRRLYLEGSADQAGWLSVVGDPKQAIYGFRGADVHTYLRARRELLAAGAQETRLEVCYRASAGMVGAVDRILADAPFLDPFFSAGIEYAPVHAAPGSRLAALDSSGRELAPLCIFHVSDAAELDAAALRASLADRIAREIASLLSDPDRRMYLGRCARQEGQENERARAGAGDDSRLDRRAVGPGDVFVLTRTTAESREIADRLRRAGIACAFYQQEGLLQSEEAAEVRDLLAAVAAPRDASARLRAWQSRFFAVPLAELPGLAEAGETHPFVQLLFQWKALADQLDYEALFPRILDDTRLVEREIALAAGERSLTNFLHLFELLLDEMLVARCDLVELVRRLGRWMDDTVGSDERNVQRLESERDAVQVMTIHRAKGLEAAVVFLFGGVGQAPHRPVQPFCRPRPPARETTGGDKGPASDATRRIGATSPDTSDQGEERWVHVGKVRDPRIAAAIEAEERGENERLLYVALTRACVRLYVASWPAGAQRRAPGSVGDLLNARLLPLCATPSGDRLIAVEDVAATGIDHDGRVEGDALADWSPPADVHRVPIDGSGANPTLARALRLQRGPITTSYTRLAQSDLGHLQDAALPHDLGEPLSVTPDLDVDLEAEADEEPAADGARSLFQGPAGADAGDGGRPRHLVISGADADGGSPDPSIRPAGDTAESQPSGRRVGIFLHEALERLPPTSAAGVDDFGAWAARGEVDELFRTAARRQDLDRVAVDWGKQVVWRGLRQPIEFGDGLVIPGVAAAARHQSEVDFLFPLCDRAGVERALVRGAIDLVFEHSGRIYWLDWKSDACAEYGPAALARHVAAHYTLQAQIYSLALARMLGIADPSDHEQRFGGLVYLFLRGPAAHVERPGFAELAESAHALAERLR